eukprot:TRINITY_DN73661_c0_g1_i1.p2 TRINITY_DN73661_c0_g1~~TRINITY_DN73661_c0_g1_i1.p2  ORF type:complete len:116 (-),score=9.13 TRINITY_DN73661_c0_g1_i1:347-643(-)
MALVCCKMHAMTARLSEDAAARSNVTQPRNPHTRALTPSPSGRVPTRQWRECIAAGRLPGNVVQQEAFASLTSGVICSTSSAPAAARGEQPVFLRLLR